MSHEAPEWPRLDLGSFKIEAPDPIAKFYTKMCKKDDWRYLNTPIPDFLASQHPTAKHLKQTKPFL
jgi:hypothetical protein